LFDIEKVTAKQFAFAVLANLVIVAGIGLSVFFTFNQQRTEVTTPPPTKIRRLQSNLTR